MLLYGSIIVGLGAHDDRIGYALNDFRRAFASAFIQHTGQCFGNEILEFAFCAAMNGRVDGIYLDSLSQRFSHKGYAANRHGFSVSRTAQLRVHHSIADSLQALAGSGHSGLNYLGKDGRQIIGYAGLGKATRRSGTGR